MNNIVRVLISLAIPLAIGYLGSTFTTPEIDGWYQSLRKPAWQPPPAVFGPVWTTLYVLMGIAFFLVWKRDAPLVAKRPAMVLFFVQLVLNLLWSFLFFREHAPGWALIDIIGLWVTLFITILAFAGVSKVAAWLLVPYISWVSFATILNYTIWSLN